MLVTRDISQILDGPLPKSTTALHTIWDKHSGSLSESSDAKDRIIESIESVRADTHQLLHELR